MAQVMRASSAVGYSCATASRLGPEYSTLNLRAVQGKWLWPPHVPISRTDLFMGETAWIGLLAEAS